LSELNQTPVLLVCADVDLLAESLNTTQKHGTAVHANEKVGLEINMEKTKYMFMSHHQNAEQDHNVKWQN
jgi:hypothetical protein